MRHFNSTIVLGLIQCTVRSLRSTFRLCMWFVPVVQCCISPHNTSKHNVSEYNLLFYGHTVVTSHDERMGSRTVIISPAISGSAHPSITTLSLNFNPSAKLVINSFLVADYAVSSTWSVYTTLGQTVSIISLTNQTKLFSVDDALSNINFPLSVNGGTFLFGNAYTFRLSVSPMDDLQSVAFSEITLTANSAPTSGYIVSSPTNGSALVTQFLLSSPSWTANVANFPLSYTYSYQLFTASPYLTIAASSLRASTVTTLPAGLLTQKFTLTLQTLVTDIYLSFSTATTPVRVKSISTTNVSQILTSSLASAFAVSNINFAVQTVNNVSTPFWDFRFL